MSTDSISRTFIGSVVCVDLVGYSTKSVAQQSTIKAAFNRLLAEVLAAVPEQDRIILDTGDGAAISFLGDPEQSLAVGLRLRESMLAHGPELGAANGVAGEGGAVRIGINLGPVKLAVDLNGYPKIIGDGINVAERITSFAKPGQIAVSRSFVDMVSRLSEMNTRLFRYEGVRTDKNAREHQIYVVDPDAAKTAPIVAAALSSTIPPQPAAVVAMPEPAMERGAMVAFLEDRFKVGFAAVLLLALIVAEAVLLAMKAKPTDAQVATAPAASPPPAVTAPAPAAPLATKPSTAPTLPVPVPPPSASAPVAAPKTAAKLPEPAAKLPEPAAKLPEPAAKRPEPAAKVPEPTAKLPEPAAKTPEATRPAPPKVETTRPAPEPVKSAPPKVEATKPAPAPEPVKTAPRREESVSRPAALQPPSPALDPSKALSRPAPLPMPAPEAPREEPKPAAPAPTTTATPIARAAVDFPPAAAARNIDAGTVKARLTIDANGAVKNVQILESRPRRYFDEEAARSLREWRFNPGADNRSYEVQINFQR